MTFRPAGLDRTLWPALLLLVAAFGLFEFSGIDLWLQDHFYNAAAGHWLVDEDNAAGRLVFYNGPKILIIAVSLAVLGLAVGPTRWRDKLRFARRDVWVALLLLVSLPALAGWGKDLTNTFCPSEIRRYGGDVPYVKLCEPYPAGDKPDREGHCFPAGHASGGFALLGLMWLRRTRSWRRGGLALGLGAGWIMGGYQMLKGAHYLSHTITTMLAAWILLLVWRRIIRPAPDDLDGN